VFVGYDKNAVEFEETEAKQDDEKAKLKKLLNMSVNEIELSVRAANCLNNANITTVGQLAMKTEARCSSTATSARNRSTKSRKSWPASASPWA
jgi:DNA-directed RNA polymerase alpha subunit